MEFRITNNKFNEKCAITHLKLVRKEVYYAIIQTYNGTGADIGDAIFYDSSAGICNGASGDSRGEHW